MDWSIDDQAKALSWMLEQRGRCKTCGTFEWQWPEEGNESHIEVDAYVCYGCERLDVERERRKEDAHHPGLKLGFFPAEE